MLPVYIHKKRTQEDSYHFNKKLLNKNDNSNKEIEDNKIDKENKKNILNNKPLRILASNKIV